MDTSKNQALLQPVLGTSSVDHEKSHDYSLLSKAKTFDSRKDMEEHQEIKSKFKQTDRYFSKSKDLDQPIDRKYDLMSN